MQSNKIYIRKKDNIPENNLHILMRSAMAVETTAVLWQVQGKWFSVKQYFFEK